MPPSLELHAGIVFLCAFTTSQTIS